MTHSVYQHWDPLEVCIVGRSYNPGFYSFIKDSKVRAVFEQIARETEEDYQSLIRLLESFGVTVLRPAVSDDYTMYLSDDGKIAPPPMTPRDYSIMLGNEFFFKTRPSIVESWSILRGESWSVRAPTTPNELNSLPPFVLDELKQFGLLDDNLQLVRLTELDEFTWGNVIDYIEKQGNIVHYTGNIHLNQFNSAMISRIGKDMYIGTEAYEEDITGKVRWLNDNYGQYRWHSVNTGGHSDGTYCPVKPGLIVSLKDVPTYKDTFPDWEVVFLPGQSWSKVAPFLRLKLKNKGKWWVPGQELNDDFTEFVNQWMDHWVGYVEETVFDVNMLVIDEKNVVCNNYNEQVFAAFERHGVTPHVVNFRHRYFWDGGLHCITSDVSRCGSMKDYFPGRS